MLRMLTMEVLAPCLCPQQSTPISGPPRAEVSRCCHPSVLRDCGTIQQPAQGLGCAYRVLAAFFKNSRRSPAAAKRSVASWLLVAIPVAPGGAPGSLRAMASGTHPPLPDLALDVSCLMDAVRQEVTQLMQEGVQKTASYCASLCAERIVTARREMQRRWAEERRELERLYGLPPNCGAGTPMSSSARCSGTSRMALAPASRAGSVHSSHEGFQPMSSQQAGGAQSSSFPSKAGLKAPRASEEHLQHNLDSTFIDAYDAVQTLEERNQQAARAMQLLDEALRAAESAGPGRSNRCPPGRPLGGSNVASSMQEDAKAAASPPSVQAASAKVINGIDGKVQRGSMAQARAREVVTQPAVPLSSPEDWPLPASHTPAGTPPRVPSLSSKPPSVASAPVHRTVSDGSRREVWGVQAPPLARPCAAEWECERTPAPPRRPSFPPHIIGLLGGYQWVDGPGAQPPQQPAPPQAPPQPGVPMYGMTQAQAGTQWVDNPNPPPVQDMVYQWVDSPSYGRPAAATAHPQPYVQAAPANPYYPGVDPAYGGPPRPMDRIDPLRPPVQPGLDPIAAQYQAGLAHYGAPPDASRYAHPQAGMAQQPLGMDDLTSIRMGGKGMPGAMDAYGQAGYGYGHDQGKRGGKGQNGARGQRQVDDGRAKGRQAVPPGRQVDVGNKGQASGVDLQGQAALETLGPEGLRQMLISTLESLYQDGFGTA
eukprot:s2147_g1.t3